MKLVDELEDMILQVTSQIGKPITSQNYKIVDRGMPHNPENLPSGKMAVYIFVFENQMVKVGRVGAKSNARFKVQHYNPNSSKSNLAKSILQDENMKKYGLGIDNVGEWIKTNTRRIDIILDIELGVFALELIEAALHYKYEPVYEGYKAQREL